MKEQQAFPTIINSEVSRGMTLRDYFAGQALQGILASSNFSEVSWNTCKAIMADSYNIADEMLKVREIKK